MAAFVLFYDVKAQAPVPSYKFVEGESIEMQLYFKWGLLMPKAGVARLSVSTDKYKGEDVWKYSLDFHTQGIFEKVFPMRDTLYSCFSKSSLRLLYSEKRSDEGKYYSVDKLAFSYDGDKTSAKSLRYTPKAVKVDTVLTADKGLLLDMLSATMFLRSIDWNNLSFDEAIPFQIAIGRDVVKSAYRYAGQQIVEYSGVKYATRHFYIDVYDEAFTQSRAAGEVWISDDERHYPVKVRAKLNIGAAEAYCIGL